ncbi:hypothetical protein CCMSSC00406_0007249 [Pleurotus cornucopiae]|uniref:Uncharacterized protein n=1 Tax=Pleurotus cornucopiae TaxID=5321 RepID=A0ACB7IKC2_PLECO|nr:hypothetical protein CCMSSC00406_0007249 [Pleurotus cornucopiae]
MSSPFPLQMPSDDNHPRDDTCLLEIPKEVRNNNHDGVFYQVNGIQNVYYCPHSAPRNASRDGVIKEGATLETTYDDGVDTGNRSRELEPYQTIIDSLSRMKHRLLTLSKRFPSNSTVTGVCSEADELVALVRYVGRTIRQIEEVDPVLITHSCFLYMQARTFSSRFLEDLGIKVPGLKRLVASLSPAQDLHHPQVDTIWVRGPTAQKWFSIPLRFCKTWKDFAIVIYRYCREGPEVEYIAQGNWAIVHVADNNIIDQTSFAGVLKPEMRFDIGIIVQLLSAMLRATQCPQCGHVNGGNASKDGWIACSNLDCNNLFRVVFKPSHTLSKSNHSEPLFRSASRNLDDSRGISQSRPAPMPMAERIHANLESIPVRPSSPSHRVETYSSPSQEQGLTNDMSGPVYPKLQYLNTKFHRVLANVPHSPLPEDQTTNSAPPGHTNKSQVFPDRSAGATNEGDAYRPDVCLPPRSPTEAGSTGPRAPADINDIDLARPVAALAETVSKAMSGLYALHVALGGLFPETSSNLGEFVEYKQRIGTHWASLESFLQHSLGYAREYLALCQSLQHDNQAQYVVVASAILAHAQQIRGEISRFQPAYAQMVKEFNTKEPTVKSRGSAKLVNGSSFDASISSFILASRAALHAEIGESFKAASIALSSSLVAIADISAFWDRHTSDLFALSQSEERVKRLTQDRGYFEMETTRWKTYHTTLYDAFRSITSSNAMSYTPTIQPSTWLRRLVRFLPKRRATGPAISQSEILVVESGGPNTEYDSFENPFHVLILSRTTYTINVCFESMSQRFSQTSVMHRLGIYDRLYRLAQQYMTTLSDLEALSDAAIEFCTAVRASMQNRGRAETSVYMRNNAETCSGKISEILPVYQDLSRQLQHELTRTLSRQHTDILSPNSDDWNPDLLVRCKYLVSIKLDTH